MNPYLWKVHLLAVWDYLIDLDRKFTKYNKDNPILIVLDNHESHTSLQTILFCRDNGIQFLTFPPHCTDRRQPLDVGLHGPYKTYLKNYCWRISIQKIYHECEHKAYSKLKLLFSTRHLLSSEVRTLLCDSLILSLFNHGEVVNGPCLNFSVISKVQKVQNVCLYKLFFIYFCNQLSFTVLFNNLLFLDSSF